jgi:hypothetical protein
MIIGKYKDPPNRYRGSCLLSLLLPILIAANAWASGGSLFDVDSAQVSSTLENYFRQAQDAVSNHDVRLARQQLSLISFKIEKYGNLIAKNDKKIYDSRVSTLKTSIKSTIDSLVLVNLSIIRTKGQAAGIEFRQKCAASGLSEIELAQVDEAIVNATSEEAPKASQYVEPSPPPPSPQPQPRERESLPAVPKKDSAAARPKTTIISTAPVQAAVPAPQKNPLLQPAPAPFKFQPAPPAPEQVELPRWAVDTAAASAQQPAAGTNHGRTMAASNAAKVFGLMNEGKNEEAMTVFNIYQENMRQYLSPAQFEQLKAMVDNAYAQDQNRRGRAQQAAQTIDDLVDQDRSAEAFAQFRAKRDELKQILGKDEFNRLETKVGRASVEFGKAQGAANVRAREIRAMLSNQKVEEASAAFEQSRAELQRCLSKDAFDELRKEVSSAIDSIKDKKRQTTLCAREIRSLIDEGKGSAANAKFSENRLLLQQNMDDKSFITLASEASKATGDFFSRQAKAQADLTRIDSLIACKRSEPAWNTFEKSKDALRKNLADDKRFFELKDRVIKAYDDFSERNKKARQSERRIESLIRHHEGRDAHIAFRLDAEPLREFLDAQRFKKLEDAQQRAYLDYESNVAAARLLAQDIDGLLTQKRVEQAYDAYKKARDQFDRYLDNDKLIDDLEKRIKEAWSDYEKRKRRAVSMVRQVQWFIQHDQGEQAQTQLKKVRPELVGFMDPKQLAGLDEASSQAAMKFYAAKALAEKNSARVRGLIDQKKFEEAYKLFKELRSNLEQYLSETTYTNLRNETTNAFDEYEGKKKKSKDFARQLKFLVERKKIQEANKAFQSNRAALKQYLSAKEFSRIEKMIVGKSAPGGAKSPIVN